MGIRIISFTEKGIGLSKRIAELFESEVVENFTKCSMAMEGELFLPVRYVEEGIAEWAKKQMTEKHTLIFIGACGIAVRVIAPYVMDKLYDSAVLVVDEKGDYIIPILSGHVGGANEIAVKIAAEIGAVPVITTATDISRKFAVDLFAKRNGLHVENRDGIAKVSSKILAGKQVILAVEQGHLDNNVCIPEDVIISEFQTKLDVEADVVITTKDGEKGALLTLKPKEYIVGIGCKRGKEEEKLNQFILKNLEEIGISTEQIMTVASIDKKKNEPGLVAWCRKQQIPFLTYTAEYLQQISGDFTASDFVKSQVGVDNVCERAALAACEYGGRLVYRKCVEDGMSIAIAKREWRVRFDEK